MGRQRRRAGRARPQVARAGRRHHGGAAEQGARRAGQRRATSCTSSPGAAAAGATRSPATPSWSGSRCGAGLVTVEGARRYGVVCDERGASTARPRRRCGDELRTGRPDQLPTFDMGPPLEDDPGAVQEETGLPAPKPPVRTMTEVPSASTTRASAARSAVRAARPAVAGRSTWCGPTSTRSRPRPGSRDVPGLGGAGAVGAPAQRRAGGAHPGRLRRRRHATAGSSSARCAALRHFVGGGPLGELMPEVAPLPRRARGRQAVRQRLLRHLAGLDPARPMGIDTLVLVGRQHQRLRARDRASTRSSTASSRSSCATRSATGRRARTRRTCSTCRRSTPRWSTRRRPWPTWGRSDERRPVEIVEVAPRDGLQNEADGPVHRGQGRARRAGGARRRPAHRGDQLRQPRRGCRRWPTPTS